MISEDRAQKSASTGIVDIYTDGTYLDNNHDWHAEDSPWKAMQIKKILDRNGLVPKTVCEIGCGAGEILRQLSFSLPATSFDGYELSPQAFELARTRTSDRVKYHLEDILEKDVHYDSLLCIDVFEHVENYLGFIKDIKPKAEYKVFHIPLDVTISSILRGGMMNARNVLGHLHYFTPDTAIATLEYCGYEIVDHMYTPNFSGLRVRSLRAQLIKIPRAILFSISPKLMSTLIGGCSILVLAR